MIHNDNLIVVGSSPLGQTSGGRSFRRHWVSLALWASRVCSSLCLSCYSAEVIVRWLWAWKPMLVGGWATPLKNISQLGWWNSQYMGKSNMVTKPPTSMTMSRQVGMDLTWVKPHMKPGSSPPRYDCGSQVKQIRTGLAMDFSENGLSLNLLVHDQFPCQTHLNHIVTITKQPNAQSSS